MSNKMGFVLIGRPSVVKATLSLLAVGYGDLTVAEIIKLGGRL